MCPSCVQAVKAEEDRHKTSSSSSSLSVQQSSKEVQTPSTNPGGCNCAACVAKRWEEHYCRILRGEGEGVGKEAVEGGREEGGEEGGREEGREGVRGERKGWEGRERMKDGGIRGRHER